MVRGHPLSNDLRLALVTMCRSMSTQEAASLTGVPKRTIQRVLNEYQIRHTHLRPNLLGEVRGGKSKLSNRDIMFLRGLVRHRPDLYLNELRVLLEDRIGVSVSESTIWKALNKAGYTIKRITRFALERDEALRAKYRYDWGVHYTPEQTIFVDESSFDRRTSTRLHGWGPKGRRVEKKCFFVQGKRYSMLPALSLNGIMHVQIVEGSFTAELFYDFIESLLDKTRPYPEPESVIVMDNARIHKDPAIVELIESRGCRVMFLPPYSPDLNPIELAFAQIKALVRRIGELGRQDVSQTTDDSYVYLHLITVAYSVQEDDALGYFHKCGYL